MSTDKPQLPAGEKTMHVTVSMDGLRRNLAREYSALVSMLNYSFKNGFEIDKEELAGLLLELRQTIGVLHCVFADDIEQFTNISDESQKMQDITFHNEE